MVSVESKKLNGKLEDALEKLEYSMVAPLVADKVNLLKKRYPQEKILLYLEEVGEALLSDLDRFKEAQPRRGEQEAPAFRKREPFEEFSVNLVLDNAERTDTPIVIEKSPSYKNLFGSLERVVDRFGYWRTDFTRIYAGSLIDASGGYLVINALDLLTEQGAWTYLKRALKNNEVEISGYDPFYMMAGSGIKPEAVQIDVKVVLIGSPELYRLLWSHDDDFKRVFKVKAEFDVEMKMNKSNSKQYFEFTRRIIDEDNLLPFATGGMQAVVEYGMKLAGRRDKLSTRFTQVADIIREAAFAARDRNGSHVERADVHRAIRERILRVNLVEEKIQDMYDRNVILVSSSGTAVGQVNGLSVYSIGEYSFGRPARITVATSLGRSGVINIEREAELSGPIHNKGVLILSGYLRRVFAQDKPLMMSASISFEQSYGGIDGDSASSTEIYAILSSLSDIPLRQDIAVTGSVNQMGEIQAIGGVNEKIEGWFDVCNSRKLTGKQGVLVPWANRENILLRPDVLEAIKAKKFHVYAIKHIDEGIEILTGKPAGRPLKNGGFSKGSVNQAVNDKLLDMAHAMENYLRDTRRTLPNNKNKDAARTPDKA